MNGEKMPREDGYFKPGNKVAVGRKGSKRKLCEAFLADMYEDWEENGKDAIQTVRMEKPDKYLSVVASLIPKELNLKVEPLEEYSDEQLANMAAQLASVIGIEASTNSAGSDSARVEAPKRLQ